MLQHLLNYAKSQIPNFNIDENVFLLNLEQKKVYIRKESYQSQRFSDYIFKNKVYGFKDKPDISFLCLMPNCHRVLITIKGEYSSLGIHQILDFSKMKKYKDFKDFALNEIDFNKIKNNKRFNQL